MSMFHPSKHNGYISLSNLIYERSCKEKDKLTCNVTGTVSMGIHLHEIPLLASTVKRLFRNSKGSSSSKCSHTSSCRCCSNGSSNSWSSSSSSSSSSNGIIGGSNSNSSRNRNSKEHSVYVCSRLRNIWRCWYDSSGRNSNTNSGSCRSSSCNSNGNSNSSISSSSNNSSNSSSKSNSISSSSKSSISSSSSSTSRSSNSSSSSSSNSSIGRYILRSYNTWQFIIIAAEPFLSLMVLAVIRYRYTKTVRTYVT
ncbi:uncharacterized protein [Penaeus vannamei]|uniref:uncharacterized protein n=1 Tax=Penaeus vannamei TaxID=6689 RepID=UPI00387F5A7C